MGDRKTSQIVEVVFEDGVLKPLGKISVVREHERATAHLYPKNRTGEVSALFGTLGAENADQMQKIIDDEFERIEGEW